MYGTPSSGRLTGYHVDGYVKNIAVDVTYHSNFGEDQIHKERAKTGDYTALTYDKTGLSTVTVTNSLAGTPMQLARMPIPVF